MSEEKALYQLRKGVRSGGVDAQTIGETMNKILAEHQRIDAELWVKTAEPEESPVHNTLEWDNAKAGHEYRLHQSRNLIRSVLVITEERKTEPVYVRVNQEHGYQPVSVVVQQPDMWAEAISGLYKDYNALRRGIDRLESIAKKNPDVDSERLMRISLAMQAMHAVELAINAIH
jgi:hypothetical protein